MKTKFIKKYMRLARQIGEDDNPCLSRSIGAVIVDPKNNNKILGTGYNGPPKDTPHCDDSGYLEKVVWPQLTPDEIKISLPDVDIAQDEQQLCSSFCALYADKGICPRKTINAPSGKRLELCSCTHAETNAIVNAGTDLYGAYMFCWCPLPCFDCTKLIINSGIKRVYCWTGADYSHGSSYLFESSNCEVIRLEKDWCLE